MLLLFQDALSCGFAVVNNKRIGTRVTFPWRRSVIGKYRYAEYSKKLLWSVLRGGQLAAHGRLFCIFHVQETKAWKYRVSVSTREVL